MLPHISTTSRRAFWFAAFFISKNTASLYRLPLLFRKRSHSRRLFSCKRLHKVFGSLSTFCELRLRRKYLNGSAKSRRNGLRSIPIFLLHKKSVIRFVIPPHLQKGTLGSPVRLQTCALAAHCRCHLFLKNLSQTEIIINYNFIIKLKY